MAFCIDGSDAVQYKRAQGSPLWSHGGAGALAATADRQSPRSHHVTRCRQPVGTIILCCTQNGTRVILLTRLPPSASAALRPNLPTQAQPERWPACVRRSAAQNDGYSGPTRPSARSPSRGERFTMPGSIEAVVGSESASIGRKVLFLIEGNYYTYFPVAYMREKLMSSQIVPESWLRESQIPNCQGIKEPAAHTVTRIKEGDSLSLFVPLPDRVAVG
jgi:hypothetical protein